MKDYTLPQIKKLFSAVREREEEGMGRERKMEKEGEICSYEDINDLLDLAN